jgi:hypothetical protein
VEAWPDGNALGAENLLPHAILVLHLIPDVAGVLVEEPDRRTRRCGPIPDVRLKSKFF